MVKISTSILGIKENFNESIKKLNQTSTDYFHVDIMDGKFVNNTSFSFEQISNISKFIDKPLDIHFMVEDPNNYIEKYKLLNPEYMTIHFEINNIDKYVKQIKDNNIKVGISIKPETKVEEIFYLLNDVDLILIMSVEPGYSGQEFIKSSLDKVKSLKQYIINNKLKDIIEIDGGINNTNSKLCIDNGVDILVSGSYITNEKDYENQINQLRI